MENNSGKEEENSLSSIEVVAPKEEGDLRTILVDFDAVNNNGEFCDNEISNTKYTIWNFLPKNLFEQFRRIANLYFLIIAVISSTPASPYPPGFNWISICFVLAVNMIKEIYEDVKRYQRDKAINHQFVQYYNPTTRAFEPIHWKDLSVGSFVHIKKDEEVPADVLLLSTTHPQGLAFIQTTNLDGETNLKPKRSISTPDNALKELHSLKMKISTQPPNANLYSFFGNYSVNYSETLFPFDISNLLLRGSKLRNTDEALGIVIYTGHDTKSVRNMMKPPFKRSRMETIINKLILFLLAVDLLSCFVASIYSTVWEYHRNEEFWYLGKETMSSGLFWLRSFFGFTVVFSPMVPISLYVSLEIVRVAQSVFIQWDVDMTHNGVAPQCKNSNLNEELGQIKYIFSDKTGTLTENSMDFRACSIGGKKYTEDQFSSLNELFQVGDENCVESAFLQILSVCHDVMPEILEKNQEKIINYSGSSPDEIALLKALQKIGITFTKRKESHFTILWNSKDKTKKIKFNILHILPFTSDRRRMSVIVETKNGVELFVKGADSIIFSRLEKNFSSELLKTTSSHIDEFANQGLRTLVCAKRDISRDFYEEWKKKYNFASNLIFEREKSLCEVFDLIENNLKLIGVTAIEDRLQEHVPRTISRLKEAGIKIWMLTGDKRETAVNVAKSCGIFQVENFSFFTIIGEDLQKIESEIQEIWNFHEKNPHKKFGVVMTGGSFSLTFADFQLEEKKENFNISTYFANFTKRIFFHKFFTEKLPTHLPEIESEPVDKMDIWQKFTKILLDAESVICCRVSPLQKSLAVQLIRSRDPEGSTLAIGDGANDVSMILTSHVGIGIQGNEGMQASLASDISLARFFHLEKLLLVHGNWNFFRMSKLILYILYKNLLIAFLQLFWAAENAFSGVALYESAFGLFYNFLFTSLPILILAVTEQHVDKKTLIENPRCYQASVKGEQMKVREFGLFFFWAIFDSVLIYYTISTQAENLLKSDGKFGEFWMMSLSVFIGMVVICTERIVVEFCRWNILSIGSIAISILAFIFMTLGYCSILSVKGLISGDSYHIFFDLVLIPGFWVLFVFILAIVIISSILTKTISKAYFPHIHQTIEQNEGKLETF